MFFVFLFLIPNPVKEKQVEICHATEHQSKQECPSGPGQRQEQRPCCLYRFLPNILHNIFIILSQLILSC